MVLASLPDPSSYVAVGWILIAIAALATGVNQVLGLFDRMKEKPPPADTYATKEHCRSVHAATAESFRCLGDRVAVLEGCHTAMTESVNKQINEMRIEIKRDICHVQSRIDELVRAVGRIEGNP